MTKEEMIAVAKIMGTADNGCPACVNNLFLQLLKVFPGKLTVEEIAQCSRFPMDDSDIQDLKEDLEDDN